MKQHISIISRKTTKPGYKYVCIYCQMVFRNTVHYYDYYYYHNDEDLYDMTRSKLLDHYRRKKEVRSIILKLHQEKRKV